MLLQSKIHVFCYLRASCSMKILF